LKRINCILCREYLCEVGLFALRQKKPGGMELYTLPAFLTLKKNGIIDSPVLLKSFPQRRYHLRIDCSSKVQQLERENL